MARSVSAVVAAGLTAVFALAPLGRAAPASPAAAPPDVLIVVTDDQRADHALATMPQTRRWLKTDGTKFSNAFATTPTCCPSRASIFTGQYVHNHGVRTSENGQADNLDQDTTMQRYLQDAGYRTGIIGKYLNGWADTEAPPFFDSWAIFVDKTSKGYFGGRWNVQGDVRRIGGYSTDFVARRANAFIESSASDDRPWFLYVAPWGPHKPYTPAPRHADAKLPRFRLNPAMFEEDRSDKPESVRARTFEPAEVGAVRRGQLRSLMSVDDLVGRLMRTLRERAELSDTLVVFLSDNGFLWGEHGQMGKRFPYTASVQIPMLVRWPGHVAEGAVDERLVANIDIAPTVLEAAGLEPQHTIDGRSLLDEFRRDRILLEHYRRAGRTNPDWASIRTDSYQYIERYVMERLLPSFREFYDLQLDPWQLENLLATPTSDEQQASATASLQLTRDMHCQGTTGPRACP